MPDDPRSALPVAPVEFSVLLALAEGPSYGYDLVRAIARRSGGSVRMTPGNLYQVLDRLLSRGWLRELAPGELPEGADARRRYYALSDLGRLVAAAEAARLQALMQSVERLGPVLSGGRTP